MNTYNITFYELMSQDFFSDKQLMQVNPLEINFQALSRKECINSSHLEAYPDASWDYPYLCQDKFFRWSNSIMKKNIHRMDHCALSKCEYFNLEWIEWYPQGDWDFSPISYFITELEEAVRYQDKNLDFKILSNKSVNLHEDWFLIFKDKKWNFKLLLRHPNFEVSWLRYFPEKCWDFQAVSLTKKPFTQKDLAYFPDANWNFKLLSQNRYLDISWLRTLSNQKWKAHLVLSNLNNKYCTLIDLLYLQSHMHLIFEPDKNQKPINYPLLEMLSHSKFFHKNIFEKFVYWMVIFNTHNFKFVNTLLPNYTFPFADVNEIPLISYEEKEELYSLLEKGIIWESYYPGMLCQLEEPLTVYNLVGDAFTIDNWSKTNIVEAFRNKYPDLGEIDIFLEEYYLSKVSLRAQKTLLLKYNLHSDGLLVYEDEEEEANTYQDDKFRKTLELNEELYQQRNCGMESKLYLDR